VQSIYCHHDGYPEHNGVILLGHYTTEEQVKELIALGDISGLEAQVKPGDGVKHSYDDPAKGVTVAYHRDRLERWLEIQPAKHVSVEEFLDYADNAYTYLFDVSILKWFCRRGSRPLYTLNPDSK